ncbi:type IV toxin-antitoxin system AbiEi family antitoxin [Kribbella catacumbae]|uniref:type IV toxin-antitoxin system AbiEi family antitoxin n=1 Tax=Kribbella catacumbae TaxID=460086 RepID=UPI0003600B05|nr:type IV toxin-antitoxin system AbiEi family antitoxin [Kribbella catacumbae]
MPYAAGRIPPDLVRRGRVLRPVDAEGIYVQPRPEFKRLEQAGALHRLANGHYAVVPDDAVGTNWLPDLEAVAMGVATTGGRTNAAALMGISAARLHAAIPRVVNVAVVAVADHRSNIRLVDRDAEIQFVRRTVDNLDLQRQDTELGSGWVTTVEQTTLDLIARPHLGGVAEAAEEAVDALLGRADHELLRDLAQKQRHLAALKRALSARN